MLQCADSEALDMAQDLPRSGFTDVELQVIRWLPSGLSFTVIGEELGLSGATVRVTAIGVYRKLGVDGRSDAVALSARLGLLRPVAVVESADLDD